MNAHSTGRRVARWLVVMVGALVLAAVGVFLSVDSKRIRESLSELLSHGLSSTVKLNGPVAIQWWPVTVVSASDVQVEAEELSLYATRVDAYVDALDIISGDLEVKHLVLVEPKVRLGVSDDYAAGTAPDALPDLSTFAFRKLEADRLQLITSDNELLSVHRIVLEKTADALATDITLVVDEADRRQVAATLTTVDGSWQFDAVRIRIDATTMTGHLALVPRAARPLLEGALEADTLAVPEGDGGSLRDALRSQVPIMPFDLTFLDASLRLAAKSLRAGGLSLNDARLPLELEDGVLRASLTGRLAAGDFSLALEHGPSAAWSARLGVQRADAGALLTSLGAPGVRSGGRIDAQATLAAKGLTLNDVVSSLNGSTEARASDVSLAGGSVDRLAGDLASALVDSLSGSSDDIALGCGVARFTVERGVLRARQSIAAQTRAVNVLGGGSISLPGYRMVLAFRPWPRSGLGLGATTLAGSFTLSGPLDEPSFAVTDDALMQGGASIGAALATGGLSLIGQGLYERAKGDDPCAVAEGRRVATGGSSAPSQGTAQSIGRSVDRATRSVTEGVKKAGSLLRRLLPRGGAADSPPETENR